MLTAKIVVLLAAFLCALGATSNPPRVPLWVSVLLLCVFGLLLVLPK